MALASRLWHFTGIFGGCGFKDVRAKAEAVECGP